MSDSPIISPAEGLFGTFRRWLRSRRQRRKTSVDLRQLPNWALRDIGFPPRDFRLPTILPGIML